MFKIIASLQNSYTQLMFMKDTLLTAKYFTSSISIKQICEPCVTGKKWDLIHVAFLVHAFNDILIFQWSPVPLWVSF